MSQTREYCQNMDAAPIEVLWSDLQREDRERLYRSKCPACPDGILMVYRKEPTYLTFSRHDRCIACGQAVHYLDADILGTPLE